MKENEKVLLLTLISIFMVTNSQENLSSKCDTTNNKIIQCDPQSCGTKLTCIHGVETPHQITKCDKTAPYCNIGRYEDYCSDAKESSSVHCYQIGTFMCSKPGYYPNVMNCQSYFYCNGDSPTVLPIFCPFGYFFHSKWFTCVRLVSSIQCYVPKCTERGIFSYKTNSQLFYTCAESERSLLIPRIHRCDKGEVFKDDECAYLCRVSGRFAHEDLTRYYECYRNGPRLEYLIRSCGSKNFNTVLKRCDYQ